MELKEARDIGYNSSFDWPKYEPDKTKWNYRLGTARGFILGYEAGVREAAEKVLSGFAPTEYLESCRKEILKLLDEVKK